MTDEWKPESVSPSSLIPVNGINFVSMNDVSQLRSMQASAGALHRNYDRGATGGALEDNEVGRSALQRMPLHRQETRSLSFTRGTRVKDTKTGQIGIIIKAKAGHTSKTNIPVHRIANTKGTKVWLGKETDLQMIL